LPPIFEDRLRSLGSWLATGRNREAIHATRPWRGALPLGGEFVGRTTSNASQQQLNVFYTVPAVVSSNASKQTLSGDNNIVFATTFWWPPPMKTCTGEGNESSCINGARILTLSLPTVGASGTCTATLMATGAAVPCARASSSEKKGINLTLGGAPPLTSDPNVASLAWTFEIKGIA